MKCRTDRVSNSLVNRTTEIYQIDSKCFVTNVMPRDRMDLGMVLYQQTKVEAIRVVNSNGTCTRVSPMLSCFFPLEIAASTISAQGGACTRSAERDVKVLAKGRVLLGLVGHCLC